MNVTVSRRVEARLAIAQVACVATIVVSWGVVASRGAVGDQALWLNVAVLGTVASGVVNGAWLLRLRRAVALRRGALLGRLDGPDGVSAAVGPGSDAALVAVAGMRLVHRPGCALVAGKPVRPAKASGEPCGWCRP